MSPARHPANHTLAICGGVGGAKLALGLYHLLKPWGLGVVVNTGDDFEHLGLHISPDIDTLLYTLAGCNNPETGWGRADETWTFMSVLESLGGATWFKLGDGDLALHVERTRRLRAGENLTQVCAALAGQMGLHARILPMSDDPAHTIVHTPDGPLSFQHYFVKEACRPRVTGITIEGAESARPNPALLESLADPALRAVVICPSNPYLSIDPILAIPGVRAALQACAAPVVAVSPIIGGRAVKGPTAKIMAELGVSANNRTIAAHYAGLIDGLVIDSQDGSEADALPLPVHVTRTLMTSLEDRTGLARSLLEFAARLDTRVAPPVAAQFGTAT